MVLLELCKGRRRESYLENLIANKEEFHLAKPRNYSPLPDKNPNAAISDSLHTVCAGHFMDEGKQLHISLITLQGASEDWPFQASDSSF